MNEYVYRHMNYLSHNEISLNDKHLSVPGLEKVPDGMLRIFEASNKTFDYTMQVNDMSYF